MPGKNGYEVAKHIKQSPALSHIPVVLLTGAFEPVDQERASEAGCDGVLAKPFEPQLVISRVKELLAKSAPRTSTSVIGPAAASVAAPPLIPAPQAATPPAVAEDDALTLPSTSEPWNTPIGQTFTPTRGSASRTESLDDYLDRLDDAFQKLGGSTPAPVPAAAKPAAAKSLDLDWFDPDPGKVGPPSEPWDFPAP